jgi:hypothetical protein
MITNPIRPSGARRDHLALQNFGTPPGFQKAQQMPLGMHKEGLVHDRA